MQTSSTAPKTMRECMPMIYKKEGMYGFFKGLPPLWTRQIPYTTVKFVCFERIMELMYKHVVPKPRAECTKTEQLLVTFSAGYLAGTSSRISKSIDTFCRYSLRRCVSSPRCFGLSTQSRPKCNAHKCCEAIRLERNVGGTWSKNNHDWNNHSNAMVYI